MPTGLIDEQYGVSSGRNFIGNLDEVQVHRLRVANWQNQPRAFAKLWAYGSKNIG